MVNADLLGYVGNDSEVMFGMCGKEVWNQLMMSVTGIAGQAQVFVWVPVTFMISRVPGTNVLIASLMNEQMNTLLVMSFFPNNLSL